MRDENENKYIVDLRHGKIIEKEQEFSQSIFSDLYEKAGKMISSIVNEDEKEGSLIAFLGERGSGKTTAMLSVLEAMKSSKRGCFGVNGVNSDKNVNFVSFDVIDASMLEEKEELFEIVLAKMLVRFMDSKMPDKRRNGRDMDSWKRLQKQFNQLFENFRIIKGSKEEEMQEPLVALKNLAISERLKHEFAELVKAFVYYWDTDEFGEMRNNQTYLVFAVDDLDMNINQGFEMLSQIHRYLLVPNIIVLVAAQYEQLEILGRKYFSKMYERLDKPIENWMIEHLHQVTKEHLEKMLPLHFRLYLPQLTNMATNFSENVKVGKERLGVKEVVLGKISRRTGIYFDCSGLGLHYLEPVSMRELNNYYWFLEGMDKLTGNPLKDKAIRLRNHKKFLNDFIHRYIVERLGVEDRREVMRFLSCPVEEWNQYIGQYLNLKKEKNANNGIMWKMFEYRERKSDYGTLLWGLHQAFEEEWISDNFLYSVITLYSIMLNRGQMLRRLGEDNKDCRQSLKIMRSGLGGLWANSIFPKVVSESKDSMKARFRYMGDCPGCWGGIIGIKVTGIQLPKGSAATWLKKYPQLVRSLEILLLFIEEYTDQEGRPNSLVLRYSFDDAGNGLHDVTVSVCCEKIDFSLLGFEVNLLESKVYFDRIHEAMVRDLMEKMGQKPNAEKIEKEINHLRSMPNVSLYQDFADWSVKSEGMLFPVQHTDIYLNLLIELQAWAENNLPSFVPDRNVYFILKNVMEQAESILNEKISFYPEAQELIENYRSCPLYQCIKNIEKSGLCDDFTHQFGRIVKRCSDENAYNELYGATDNISTTENVRREELRW